jgi:hypothetical protein
MFDELFPGTTYQIGKLSIRPMITSKKMMLDVMKNCDGADTLTREEKFQVFVNVCDNMLNEGRMTKATHKRFTHIF